MKQAIRIASRNSQHNNLLYLRCNISNLCKLFKISRQSLYKFERRVPLVKDFNDKILKIVSKLRYKHTQMGCRKIKYILKKYYNLSIGKNQLFSLLKAYGLLAIRKKRSYKGKSRSKDNYIDNLSKKMSLETANDLLISDITYLRFRGKFRYLSLTADAFSRKIIGWDLSDSLESSGVIKSLNMAVKAIPLNCFKDRKGKLPIVHHSDQGSQYLSNDFKKCVNDNGMIMSTTYKGNCYDNAKCERINNTIKNEYGLGRNFNDEKQLKKSVEQAIYLYNNERPHWALGLKTPHEVYSNCT